MKKPRFWIALALMFLVLIVDLPAYEQTDESTHQLNLAHSYVQEQRYQDALDALQKAYDIKPSSEILAEMGSAFHALCASVVKALLILKPESRNQKPETTSGGPFFNVDRSPSSDLSGGFSDLT